MPDKPKHKRHKFDKPGQVPPEKWTVARPMDNARFVADPLPVQPPPGYRRPDPPPPGDAPADPAEGGT